MMDFLPSRRICGSLDNNDVLTSIASSIWKAADAGRPPCSSGVKCTNLTLSALEVPW
ncbi:hypothetical protein F5Y04DRAFT_248520 [Hypomontagnella monticulosa]|nr:hypothetical protein F5Y04DRAFT_248520 [Hypomontagnella monticulosa]